MIPGRTSYWNKGGMTMSQELQGCRVLELGSRALHRYRPGVMSLSESATCRQNPHWWPTNGDTRRSATCRSSTSESPAATACLTSTVGDRRTAIAVWPVRVAFGHRL